MHISKVRAVVSSLVIAAAVGYSGSGIIDRLGAAGPPSPQQGKSARKPVDLATALQERTSRGSHRCAVHDATAEQQTAIEQAVNAAGVLDSGAVVDVGVYWHIITTESGGGNVSALVPAQMKVLNAAFGASGFNFVLKGVSVIASDPWFFAAAGSPEEEEMKARLRRGGPEALNIYTTNGDVFLGWATFPFYYKFYPSYDGVVLWWASMPGTGLQAPVDEEPDGVLTYDQGDTGTHEVGHWLGLGHTFAGGCSHPGDSVKDTPAESGPQFFCIRRDSCTGPVFPGEDPITNFMDYVDDVCMDHFTQEQTKRMRKHWHAFRDKKAR
jgi:hypothetical protein